MQILEKTIFQQDKRATVRVFLLRVNDQYVVEMSTYKDRTIDGGEHVLIDQTYEDLTLATSFYNVLKTCVALLGCVAENVAV